MPSSSKSAPTCDTAVTSAIQRIPCHRESLDGCWILDKTRGSEDEWSMSPYLQVMQVDPLAIQAHEKGDRETDTFHTIEFLNNRTAVRVIKRSRVNNDLTVQLQLGMTQPPQQQQQNTATDDDAMDEDDDDDDFGKDRKMAAGETVEYLAPGNRPKRQQARSNHPGHLEIRSSLQTLSHGLAKVTDVKELIQEQDADGQPTSVLLQKLVIVNDLTGKSHLVTRYFVPYTDTPPHLLMDDSIDTSTDVAETAGAVK